MTGGIVPNHPASTVRCVALPQLTQEGNRQEGNRGGTSCCYLPVPATPPLRFPDTPPSSSSPSPHVAGWRSPPAPVHPSGWPADPHPPESEPRQRRISWPQFVGPPPPRRCTSLTKPSRRTGSALTNRFLGRFRTNQPVQVIQATTPAQRQPERSSTNRRTAFQAVGQIDASLRRQFLHRRLQLGLPLPVQCGGEPPDCSKASAQDHPGPECRGPLANSVGVPFQRRAAARPSSLAPATTPRATVPAPEASALGTSVVVPQPHRDAPPLQQRSRPAAQASNPRQLPNRLSIPSNSI